MISLLWKKIIQKAFSSLKFDWNIYKLKGDENNTGMS
jgi:hypothetical protein